MPGSEHVLALDFVETIRRDGCATVCGTISPQARAGLIDGVPQFSTGNQTRAKAGSLYAVRNLLAFEKIRSLARSTALLDVVIPILGRAARPVRGILFDKTAGANWKVAWHQDLSIAVRERMNVIGFGPWSVKAGVQHVQPPVEVLRNMLTLRLHLDNCFADNGPLRVLPGSHAQGVLSPSDILTWREKLPPVDCLCPAGGILLMRPLLLHASSPASVPGHRRVIHLEYAAGDLPGGLQWQHD